MKNLTLKTQDWSSIPAPRTMQVSRKTTRQEIVDFCLNRDHNSYSRISVLDGNQYITDINLSDYNYGTNTYQRVRLLISGDSFMKMSPEVQEAVNFLHQVVNGQPIPDFTKPVIREFPQLNGVTVVYEEAQLSSLSDKLYALKDGREIQGYIRYLPGGGGAPSAFFAPFAKTLDNPTEFFERFCSVGDNLSPVELIKKADIEAAWGDSPYHSFHTCGHIWGSNDQILCDAVVVQYDEEYIFNPDRVKGDIWGNIYFDGQYLPRFEDEYDEEVELNA